MPALEVGGGTQEDRRVLSAQAPLLRQAKHGH